MLVPEASWESLWGRVAWQLHVQRQRAICQTAGSDSKVALAQTPALHMAAVKALLDSLDIHSGMSRVEMRQWLEGPRMQELKAGKSPSRSPELGLGAGSHASVCSQTLARGSSWVGMGALKRLGATRSAHQERKRRISASEGSAPARLSAQQRAFQPLDFAPK